MTPKLKELMGVTGMLDTMTRGMEIQLELCLKSVPASQASEVRAAVESTKDAVFAQAADWLGAYYTEEELEHIIAFMRTSAGKKFQHVAPEFMQQAHKLALTWLTAIEEQLMPAFLKEDKGTII